MSMPSNNANAARDGTLGIGEILSSAFTLATRHIIGLFVLILPIYLLYVAMFGGMYLTMSILLTGGSAFNPAALAAANPAARFGAFFFVLEALYMVAWLVCCCAMVSMIHARFNRMPESVLSSILRGASRSLPMVGLALLVLLGFAVVMIVVGLVLSLLARLLGPVVVVLSFAAFIAVFYAFFPYILSGIVCVVERTGPLDSLARSRELMNGYRWPMFGLMLVLLLILAILEFVLLFIFRIILANSAFGFYFIMVIGAILFPYVTGWTIAIYTIAYNRLNMLKGGQMSGSRVTNVFE